MSDENKVFPGTGGYYVDMMEKDSEYTYTALVGADRIRALLQYASSSQSLPASVQDDMRLSQSLEDWKWEYLSINAEFGNAVFEPVPMYPDLWVLAIAYSNNLGSKEDPVMVASTSVHFFQRTPKPKHLSIYTS